MNNKGQALVFVVILIPIIAIIIMGVMETVSVTYQKTRITSNIKTIISSCYNKCSDEEIKNLLAKNDISYEALEINKGSFLKINVKAKVSSMIGNIINKDFYTLDINLMGRIENKKLVIKKG